MLQISSKYFFFKIWRKQFTNQIFINFLTGNIPIKFMHVFYLAISESTHYLWNLHNTL